MLTEARIRAVGTAVPETSWAQADIMEGLGLQHPIVRRLLRAGYIEKRHLLLPERDPSTGLFRTETMPELRAKFEAGSRQIGGEAIRDCLERAAEEGLGGGHVPGLAQSAIDEVPMKTVPLSLAIALDTPPQHPLGSYRRGAGFLCGALRGYSWTGSHFAHS